MNKNESKVQKKRVELGGGERVLQGKEEEEEEEEEEGKGDEEEEEEEEGGDGRERRVSR